MQSQIESGTELLARLNSKPKLCRLEGTLFLEGPRNTDIIEIGGERSTGKTLLLTQMLANCILPNYYRTAEIEGCNASAILINTDHHFEVSKLAALISDIVDTIATDIDKVTIVRNSLRNLRIINCYDSEQFSLTLRTLDDIFLDNAKIALLAIDSIAAYYWEDCEDNVITVDTYVKKLLKLIKTHTTRFNIVTIYTRLYEDMYKQVKNLINDIDYKVELCRVPNSKNLICTLKSEAVKVAREMCYSILSNGIKWNIDEGE
ncbi:X-ray repair cross complementing 2 [Xylocopa sonorina]|uniref:X-ray repair cross complementing 2 n=1 Tax=Xylocopa sonorina TaxID=1818115 RepID=UPI00403AC9C3